MCKFTPVAPASNTSSEILSEVKTSQIASEVELHIERNTKNSGENLKFMLHVSAPLCHLFTDLAAKMYGFMPRTETKQARREEEELDGIDR